MPYPRNPRERRGYVFGLLEHARASGDIEAFRAAQAGVESIGPGSRHSPRELFGRTLANVAKTIVNAAMDDPATAAIVRLGGQVLEAPFYPTGYSTGTHSLMGQTLHEARTTKLLRGTPYHGRLARVALWKALDGEMVQIGSRPTMLDIAHFEEGNYVSGGRVPLLTETLEERLGTHTLAITGVDALGVRLLPDDVRNDLAQIAAQIEANGNESGPIKHERTEYLPIARVTTVHLPAEDIVAQPIANSMPLPITGA